MLSLNLNSLAAADQFCIRRLKAMCKNKLLEFIFCENTAFILFKADQHDASVLKSKAPKFLRQWSQMNKFYELLHPFILNCTNFTNLLTLVCNGVFSLLCGTMLFLRNYNEK